MSKLISFNNSSCSTSLSGNTSQVTIVGVSDIQFHATELITPYICSIQVWQGQALSTPYLTTASFLNQPFCLTTSMHIPRTTTHLLERSAQWVLQGKVLCLQGGVVALQLLQTGVHDVHHRALDGPHGRRQRHVKLHHVGLVSVQHTDHRCLESDTHMDAHLHPDFQCVHSHARNTHNHK